MSERSLGTYVSAGESLCVTMGVGVYMGAAGGINVIERVRTNLLAVLNEGENPDAKVGVKASVSVSESVGVSTRVDMPVGFGGIKSMNADVSTSVSDNRSMEVLVCV